MASCLPVWAKGLWLVSLHLREAALCSLCLSEATT